MDVGTTSAVMVAVVVTLITSVLGITSYRQKLGVDYVGGLEMYIKTLQGQVHELQTRSDALNRQLNDCEQRDRTIRRIEVQSPARREAEERGEPNDMLWLYTKLSSTDYFGESDLQALSFVLGIDYEQLRGTNKQSRAQSLVVECKHNGRLDELRSAVFEARPILRQEYYLRGAA